MQAAKGHYIVYRCSWIWFDDNCCSGGFGNWHLDTWHLAEVKVSRYTFGNYWNSIGIKMGYWYQYRKRAHCMQLLTWHFTGLYLPSQCNKAIAAHAILLSNNLGNYLLIYIRYLFMRIIKMCFFTCIPPVLLHPHIKLCQHWKNTKILIYVQVIHSSHTYCMNLQAISCTFW